MSTTQSTAPDNTFLPPGAPDPASPSDYPAVTIVDEAEHKAAEEKAAEERVERAKSVSSPKRLSSQEMLKFALLAKLLPEGESVPIDTPIPLESLPEEMRKSFFEPGSTRNLAQRGIVKLNINTETKQYDTISITEMALHLYTNKKIGPSKQKSTTKADGTPRAPGGRSTSAFAGLRMRKLAENPREEGTMGYYSWQLYKDGMTYKEYMSNKDYPESISKRTQERFRGPGRNHWDWDLMHGYIGLYRENESELLEDGSPNPNFWVINNSVKTVAKTEEPKAE